MSGSFGVSGWKGQEEAKRRHLKVKIFSPLSPLAFEVRTHLRLWPLPAALYTLHFVHFAPAPASEGALRVIGPLFDIIILAAWGAGEKWATYSSNVRLLLLVPPLPRSEMDCLAPAEGALERPDSLRATRILLKSHNESRAR